MTRVPGGPPYVANGDAAYFHSAYRNKKSVAINIASPGGADLVTRMSKPCARREQSDNPRPNLHAFMNRPNASLWLQQDLAAHPPELGQVQRGVRLCQWQEGGDPRIRQLRIISWLPQRSLA